MYQIIILIVVIIAFLVLLGWFFYSVTSAYQQSLSISIPFNSTYRYIPKFNLQKKYQLDKIKVKVAAPLRNKSLIISGKALENIVNEHIIQPYMKTLLVQEVNMFSVDDQNLKRCPTVKSPTVENLAVLFFSKLEKFTGKAGCHLISVSVYSDGVKATQTRFKASNYNGRK